MADAFALLPDCVVVEILCRLGSVKWLLRCEAVCKRWNGLCASVDVLVFDEECDKTKAPVLIWKILSYHSFKVRQLQITTNQGLENCMRSWLKLVSASLEALSIADYIFVRKPSCLMPCLASCKLENVEVPGAWIERFVQLCPLLKELQLIRVFTDVTLRIAAPNLESAFIGFDEQGGYLEVDSPKLLRLEVQGAEKLVVASPFLQMFVQHSPAQVEFRSIPKLSRWILARGRSGYHTKWTIEEILSCLESAENIQPDIVELQCLVRIDIDTMNRNCVGLLQNIRIDRDFLKSFKHAFNKTWLLQHLKRLGVASLRFDEQLCDALTILLDRFQGLESVYLYCDKVSLDSATSLNKVLGLQQKFMDVKFSCITGSHYILSKMAEA